MVKKQFLRGVIMIGLKDLIINSSGVGAYGEPKTTLCIKNSLIDIVDGYEEELDAYILDSAEIQIYRGYRFTTVDVIFSNPNAVDLIGLHAALKEYNKVENSIEDESDKVPCISLTIMPDAYKGLYYMVGIHGAWFLTSTNTGKENNCIKFMFENEFFNAFELPEDAVDYDELEANLTYEMEREEKLAQKELDSKYGKN